MTSIYDDGRHYDLLNLIPVDRGLPFYERQIKKYGGPVLELACGTGRLTIPLRLAGTDITGLDSSPGMLQAAREKAKSHGIEIEYVLADLRAYSLNRLFRLIFVAHNSLLHLLRREEIEACLRCVRQHLAPDGRFVSISLSPSVHILAREQRPYPLREYEDPDGRGHITVTETNRYDPAAQVNHITWHYKRIGEPEAWDVEVNLRMYYPQEIDALLIYNGFTIEQKYGDFEETPFGPESQKQLIVCRASGMG